MGAVSSLPRLEFSSGTLEGLKWTGLALMTVDHINKYLLHERIPAMFVVGRLCLPLFGVVLAYNLARPETLESGVYPRLLARLALIGIIAEIPFVALGGLGWGWWPLNVFAMLLLSTSIMWLVDLGGRWRMTLAVLLFVLGGAFVEFWWPGVVMCLAAWAYCRRPNWWAVLLWSGAIAALYVINRNMWALAALPIIVFASRVRLHIPRLKWAFYAYYPAHLGVLWLFAPRL